MTTAAIRLRLIPVVLLFALLLPACASYHRYPVRPAVINHVVFIKLADPGDRNQLIADSDRLLIEIPGVVSYYAGEHVDIGRPNVVSDYDVGLYVGFASVPDYEAYLAHPNHVQLVEDWKPRMQWLRVYDIRDDSN